MTYRGKVANGVIVLEEGVKLPEGADVRVEAPSPEVADESHGSGGLAEALLEFAGKATGLPSDASRNHDHYLYGTSKR
jgi:hypothetical protein